MVPSFKIRKLKLITMKIPFYLLLGLCAFIVACGPNEEADMEQSIDALETVFDQEEEPPANTPDYKPRPMKARKQLQAQVKEASSLMRQEKYDAAMDVLNGVRTNPYIDANQKMVIDDAMRRSQRSLAKALQSGTLSPQEEARIRAKLSRR